MKQKNQIVLLVALVVVAAVVWVWVSRTSTANSGGVSVAENYAPLAVENPAPHIWKLENSRKTEYKSAGRNPFSETAPAPPAPAVRVARPGEKNYVPPPPPPPPPPPELPPNLKFFGYGVVPVGTGRLAFFSDGNDVFIVGEGDVLMGRYRIVKINNANLEFEEVGTGRRGSTMLQDQGSGLQG